MNRFIKGTAANDIIVRFALPTAPVGYEGLSSGTHGLLFLASGNQGLRLYDPYHARFPAALRGTIAGATTLDRILNELIAVVAAQDEDLQERIVAAELLKDRAEPAIIDSFQRLAADPTVPEGLRLRAVATLLRQHQTKALPLATAALLAPGLDERVRSLLAYAIEDSVREVDAIPFLNELLSSPHVSVRRAASAALRHTESPAAIEGLKRSLWDGDQRVRYNGVLGLASIMAEYKWAPDLQEYQTKEKFYLDHWKSWAGQ